MSSPTCPYCKSKSARVKGDVIYPHRKDLHSKIFYLCAPCKAYVGCHGNTDTPLGRLANADLRAAKMRAHRSFDPIWQNGQMNRSQAYTWLAGMLGIESNKCHIGMFDVDMCNKVVKISTNYGE